jgi:hypothetical protein
VFSCITTWLDERIERAVLDGPRTASTLPGWRGCGGCCAYDGEDDDKARQVYGLIAGHVQRAT